MLPEWLAPILWVWVIGILALGVLYLMVGACLVRKFLVALEELVKSVTNFLDIPYRLPIIGFLLRKKK